MEKHHVILSGRTFLCTGIYYKVHVLPVVGMVVWVVMSLIG